MDANLENAKQISLGYHNKPEFKDVFVTFPDQSIYVDCSPSDLAEHIKSRKLTAIIVKKDGKMVGSVETVVEEKVEDEPKEESGKKKKSKK